MAILEAGWEQVAAEQPEQLSVFNGGNFTNNREIVPKAQIAIARWVGQQASIQTMLIENRPEFCHSKRIQPLVEALNGKRLVVAIGLECLTPAVLAQSINKGYTKEDFERAVGWLKEVGAEVSVYVFLKPLFLTEREAIEEAVRTITYAQSLDPFEVALESGMVMPDTIMADEYAAGNYRPPWIWSTVEVVQRTHQFGPLQVGAFKEEPPPIAYPRNYGCDQCGEHLERLLQDYSVSQQPNALLDYQCTCKQHWLDQLDRTV